MSDNLDPEIRELRLRVLTLESELARTDPNKAADHKILPLHHVNRVEIMDSQGRAYGRSVPNAHWSLSLKDDGQTLVVYIDHNLKD